MSFKIIIARGGIPIMKKTSLVSASVVAAALLAVAPVAAPAISSVSGTQVVKADATSDATNVLNAIQSTSVNYDLNKTATTDKLGSSAFNLATSDLSAYAFPREHKLTVNDLMDESNAVKSNFLKPFQTSIPVTDSPLVDAVKGDAVKVTVSSGSLQLNTVDEVTNKINDIKLNGGSLTATYTIYDNTNKAIASKAFTMNATVPNTANTISSVYVQSPASFDVKSGTPVSNYNYGGTADVKAVDQNGKAISDATVTALVQKLTNNGSNTENWLPASGNFEDSTEVNGVKTPNYYRQQVTIKLPASAAKATVYVNGQQVAADTNGNYVFNRTINLGGVENTTGTTLEKIKGVAVVNSDITYAQLVDRQGNAISARVLPANTSWAVDGKLTTLINNKVYYKVSPKEYVAASDVTFTPSDSSTSNSDNNSSAITTTKEKGVFNTATDGVATVLFNLTNGKFVSNPARLIPSGTSWSYDKKAVVGGTTYYKVSPTEWISSASKGTAVPAK